MLVLLKVAGVVRYAPDSAMNLKCIDGVNSGQYWVGQERVLDLMQAVCQMNTSNTPSGGRRDLGLTVRERHVIALVAAGYTDMDLAQKLGISESIAKYQLTNVFDKLGVSDRLELVLLALDRGLIKED
jgi:DNA-binding CsgD family transcriptional regulator